MGDYSRSRPHFISARIGSASSVATANARHSYTTHASNSPVQSSTTPAKATLPTVLTDRER